MDLAVNSEGLIYVVNRSYEESGFTLEAVRVNTVTMDDDFLGEFGQYGFRAVLRPGPAGYSLEKGIHTVLMSDREGGKLRNPRGREYYGQSKEAQWEDLTGPLAGVRRKVLFGNDDEKGPKVQIWECPPNMAFQGNVALFGEYHVVLKGSARWGDREMKPYSMRYVVGDEPPTQITVGLEGTTWLILTYDQAAELKSPTRTSVKVT